MEPITTALGWNWAQFSLVAVATTASGYLIVVVPRFFDRKLGLALGVVWGFGHDRWLLGGAMGGATGPVLFGLRFDTLGSYSLALWPGIVLFVLAALGLQTLGTYQYGPGCGVGRAKRRPRRSARIDVDRIKQRGTP